MKCDGIIFDKDGTLLDFNAFWVPVTQLALQRTVNALGAENISIEKLMEAIGVYDGITDIDGILCHGTYAQIGEAVWQSLAQQGFHTSCQLVQKLINEAYVDSISGGKIAPTCQNLALTLQRLQEKGIRLFVVTTDNQPVTAACLEQLGISQYFTAVYTDDGVNPPKPDPYCAEHICSTWNIPKDRLLMVGDTKTDAVFAKNAGISVVGVAANEENAKRLGVYMQTVLPDVSYIPDLLEG